MKLFVELLFRRSLISACVGGAAIHIMLALCDYVGFGKNYVYQISQEFSAMPLFTTIKVMTPFFIPLIVILISRRITEEKVQKALMRFPESNPDIIIKLDEAGRLLYLNTSARYHIEQLGISPDEAVKLLPDGYKDILKELHGPEKTLFAEKEIGDLTFEFIFRLSRLDGAVFVSGRNITGRKRLEHSLATSHDHLLRMTNFLDRTLESYDPLTFAISKHYHLLMETLIAEHGSNVADKPTHIFLAEKDPSGFLSGHVYNRNNAAVIKDPEIITIEPGKDRFAITLGEHDVVWSNWENEGVSLAEYQSRFNEKVRRKVGSIERFATYTSGNIAIIAFYKGAKLDKYDAYALKGLAVYANSLKRISMESKETENAFIYTIEALARAAEANDEDTGEHIIRVNEYSRALAEQLGMDADFTSRIHYSAQMHDVGKIHVHPDILKKPGKLTDEEFIKMRQHPIYGPKILGDSARLAMASEIALSHHEKFNGKGYPRGLKGEDIPLSGRIVMIADVYDALRQKRVYKPALPHDEAVRIITRGDGRTDPSDFDPKVLDAFMKTANKFDGIFSSYKS